MIFARSYQSRNEAQNTVYLFVIAHALNERLKKSWRTLEGKPCISVIYGKGSGSRISLDFGRWVERKKRLTNPNLREVEQTHEGEFGLFITGAAWRLDLNDVPQCSSVSDNGNDGHARRTLLQLVGKSIAQVELAEGSWDCVISFESGFKFRIFCVEANSLDPDDNYCLFIPGASFTVEHNSVVLEEPKIGLRVV